MTFRISSFTLLYKARMYVCLQYICKCCFLTVLKGRISLAMLSVNMRHFMLSRSFIFALSVKGIYNSSLSGRPVSISNCVFCSQF